jgi:hypothetical protein
MIWNAVTGIELAKAVNDDVRKVWSFFYWTEQTYPWEILVRLAEARFEEPIPGTVLTSVGYVFESMLTTTVAELAARNVKIRSTANLAGKLSRVEKWHSLATSQILADHDRKPMTITEAAKNASPKDIPSSIFEATVHDHSLQDTISTLTSEATWLNLSPQRREQCFVAMSSFVALQGDIHKMLRIWQGLLCVAGSLIWRKGAPMHCFLVFHVTPHGVCARACRLRKEGDHKIIELVRDPSGETCIYRTLAIHDCEEWMACKVRLLAPFETHEKRPAGAPPPL